jgi:hypothetical protein
LETAQKWRERLGQPREKKWYDVIAHLSPLTTHDGLYVAAETAGIRDIRVCWCRLELPTPR